MIYRYLRWGLLGAVAVGLTYTGTSLELKSGDWAAWVGAIGTVGTLIGTIYLATSQSRQKARDDLTLARLHAARMVLRLVHAEAMISSACQTLSTSLQTPIQLSVDNLKDMQFRLSSIAPWEMGELVPLVALRDNTAVKLAHVSDQLDSAKKLFTGTISHYGGLSADELHNFTEHVYAMLRTTLDYVQEVVNVCNEESGALHHRRR